MTTSFSYLKDHHCMPFLERGMRVEVNGRMGVVTSGNGSGNIDVRFDGERLSVNCHPQWKTRYFDEEGKVIADYYKKQ